MQVLSQMKYVLQLGSVNINKHVDILKTNLMTISRLILYIGLGD